MRCLPYVGRLGNIAARYPRGLQARQDCPAIGCDLGIAAGVRPWSGGWVTAARAMMLAQWSQPGLLLPASAARRISRKRVSHTSQ